jgi:hypothetical protein
MRIIRMSRVSKVSLNTYSVLIAVCLVLYVLYKKNSLEGFGMFGDGILRSGASTKSFVLDLLIEIVIMVLVTAVLGVFGSTLLTSELLFSSY